MLTCSLNQQSHMCSCIRVIACRQQLNAAQSSQPANQHAVDTISSACAECRQSMQTEPGSPSWGMARPELHVTQEYAAPAAVSAVKAPALLAGAPRRRAIGGSRCSTKRLSAATFTRGRVNRSSSDSSCHTSWRFRYSKDSARAMLARWYTNRMLSTRSSRLLHSHVPMEQLQRAALAMQESKTQVLPSSWAHHVNHMKQQPVGL